MRLRQVPLSVIFFLTLVACSSTPKSRPELDQEAPEQRPLKESRSSASDTIQTVEAKLKHTKGKVVLISKELLKRLLEEEKAAEQARVRLSGQLEALKKIDREEPQKFVQ